MNIKVGDLMRANYQEDRFDNALVKILDIDESAAEDDRSLKVEVLEGEEEAMGICVIRWRTTDLIPLSALEQLARAIE